MTHQCCLGEEIPVTDVECERTAAGVKDAAVCLTFTVPEAGAMVGLTRNAAYAAAKRGEIPTMSFGRQLRVPKATWLRMLEQQPK